MFLFSAVGSFRVVHAVCRRWHFSFAFYSRSVCCSTACSVPFAFEPLPSGTSCRCFTSAYSRRLPDAPTASPRHLPLALPRPLILTVPLDPDLDLDRDPNIDPTLAVILARSVCSRTVRTRSTWRRASTTPTPTPASGLSLLSRLLPHFGSCSRGRTPIRSPDSVVECCCCRRRRRRRRRVVVVAATPGGIVAGDCCALKDAKPLKG